MIPEPSPSALDPSAAPRRWVGGPLAVTAYLGGLGILAVSAARAALWTRRPAPPLWRTGLWHLDRTLVVGLPLVTLVCIPLGSFLAMQAYFHATFTDAVGAVVGLGLLRNLSSLASGFVLVAVSAARFVPELRRRPHVGLDDLPGSVPDRDVVRGLRPDDRIAPEPARLAAVRVLAAMAAGPVLALWGALTGLTIGLLVARSKLTVAPGLFLGKMLEMIVPYDLVSLAVKATAFAAIAGLVACHEGLRGTEDPEAVPGAVFRAACVAIAGILLFNGSWFTLNYLSGAPFGPVLVAH